MCSSDLIRHRTTPKLHLEMCWKIDSKIGSLTCFPFEGRQHSIGLRTGVLRDSAVGNSAPFRLPEYLTRTIPLSCDRFLTDPQSHGKTQDGIRRSFRPGRLRRSSHPRRIWMFSLAFSVKTARGRPISVDKGPARPRLLPFRGAAIRLSIG